MSFIVRSPSLSYSRSSTAASVVNVVLAVVGTILNFFVLFIFWKSPKLRLKLFSFAIMLLCSIDLGVGTVANLLFVLKSITMLDSPKCLYIGAYKIAILFFSGISACTVLIINIERYFAIIHPFWYQIHFTKRRFVFTWVFFWFLVLVWIVCRVYFRFYPNYSRYHSYFHIFVHVRCNIRRCEKKDIKETMSTVTAIMNHAEISWPFYEN